jgi:serine/threonine protein phosphatase PrpC
MRYLAAHAQHVGARRYQQDSLGLADPQNATFLAHGGFLAVLCDGMGGMEHGDVASETAVRAFLESYARKLPAESIPAALERSARTANQQVIDAALKLGFKDGVGTTLVAAVLHAGALYFISIGDSAVFHVRGRQIQTVNHPHVFANLLDQAAAKGQISAVEAAGHPEREALTSFVGIHELHEIDRNIEPWPVAMGETILLASDGLFKTLDPAGMVDCLTGHPQSWPQSLVSRTLDRQHPSQDNVTVISITPDTGVLGPWAPPAAPREIPELRFGMFNATPKPGTRLLLAGTVVILIAAAFGGLWYFSMR